MFGTRLDQKNPTYDGAYTEKCLDLAMQAKIRLNAMADLMHRNEDHLRAAAVEASIELLLGAVELPEPINAMHDPDFAAPLTAAARKLAHVEGLHERFPRVDCLECQEEATARARMVEEE